MKPENVATPADIVNHLFVKGEDGEIIHLNSNKEIIASLCDSGAKFTHFKQPKSATPISINVQNMKTILTSTLADQQIKVRASKKHSGRHYIETFEARMDRLLKRYPHLKMLKVVPKNGKEKCDDLPETKLAKLAAAEFVQLVGNQKGEPTVAIGGGQTMRSMSLYVDLREVRPFKSVPLNLVMRVPEDKVFDSSAIAMSIYRLASKGSTAHIISIPPTPRKSVIKALEWHSMLFNANEEIQNAFHASLDPDIVFVGAGNFNEDSQAVTKLMAHLGIDYKFLKSFKPRPVGDLNFCLFDADGEDITPKVLAKITSKHCGHDGVETYFPEEEFCHPFFVGVNMKRLQNLVAVGKSVVVVAGGFNGSKAEALHALLKARVMNCLITDSETLSQLLEIPA